MRKKLASLSQSNEGRTQATQQKKINHQDANRTMKKIAFDLPQGGGDLIKIEKLIWDIEDNKTIAGVEKEGERCGRNNMLFKSGSLGQTQTDSSEDLNQKKNKFSRKDNKEYFSSWIYVPEETKENNDEDNYEEMLNEYMKNKNITKLLKLSHQKDINEIE